MQDQTLKPSHSHEMSRQSSVQSFHKPYSHCSESDDDDDLEEMSRQSSVPGFHGPSSHFSESSDDDLEETSDTPLSGHSRILDNLEVPNNQGTSGDPLVSGGGAPMSDYLPMPDDSRMPNNAQTHNNQQTPGGLPTPDFGPNHGYPPTDSYPPTHSYYSAHGYPPIQAFTFHLPLNPGLPLPYGHPYMVPDHHLLPKYQTYGSAPSLSRPSIPGTTGKDLQPNAELSSPPVPQGLPLKNQPTDTRHSTPAHAPANNPAQPHFPPPGSTHREEFSKDIQSPRTEMAATENQKNEIIIAVMGVTGTGKSYFIKEVSGFTDVGVSSSLHSCTTKVQAYSFPYAGAKITLVDTPGFNDTTKSDTQVLIDICTWMKSYYEKGKLLSGIIYLHNINDVRMSGSSVKYVKMFQKLCGPSALQNVLLTTTQWSNVDQTLGEEREGELRSGDFWGGLIKEGASVERFMGIRESGLELIDKLIENQPKPLDIQHQIVDEGKTLAQTNAGAFMNEELASLHIQYQKELQDLKSELQKAIREKDDLFKEILKEQQAQSQKKLEEAAAEKKYLEDFRADMMRKLEEAENEREEERQKRDKAVIAVASDEIDLPALTESLMTKHTARGRLIYDINNPGEFEKETFNVEIGYQTTILFPLKLVLEKATKFFRKERRSGTGLNSSSYIIYDQGYYLCKPSLSIQRRSQNFVIFARS